MSTKWYVFKCNACQAVEPKMVVVRWGIDHQGTLIVEGICRHCYHRGTITHTQDEILGDMREMFLEYLFEQSDPMATDMLIWENQMLEGRQLTEGDDTDGV